MKKYNYLSSAIIKLFVLTLVLTLAPAGFAKETFVIIHGAFQDANVWTEVKAGLEKSGNEVIVVNLPGRKGNEAAPETLTLAKYRDEIIKAVGKRQNVVLVGHSFAGIQISNVAETIPAQIKMIVYVAAYYPQNGDSLQSLSALDKNKKLTEKNFILAPDYKTVNILESDREMLFCNDCSSAAKKNLSADFVIEPLAPFGEKVSLTDANFGRVKKIYVHTKLDNVITYPFQQQMTARTKPAQTFTLEAGHSPFLSQPKKLVKILIKAAKS